MEEKKNEKNGEGTFDQKAKDLKSSGIMLIAVGAAGLLCVLLVGINVIPLHMQGIMKYMSMGVMGFLFLVFLFSGVGSLKKSGTAEADALRKNEKKEEILKWFAGEYDAAKIDEAIASGSEDDTDPDETEDDTGSDESDTDSKPDENELYFERTGFMKERINERFLELDDALLSDITDRLYTDIFG